MSIHRASRDVSPVESQDDFNGFVCSYVLLSCYARWLRRLLVLIIQRLFIYRCIVPAPEYAHDCKVTHTHTPFAAVAPCKLTDSKIILRDRHHMMWWYRSIWIADIESRIWY